MGHGLAPYQLTLGTVLRVTLSDGQTLIMRVSQRHPAGSYGRAESAGPRIIAHIRPGGFSISLDSAEISAAEIIPHANYSHHPGTLYDCAACDATCHCVAGQSECVFEGEHTGVGIAPRDELDVIS